MNNEISKNDKLKMEREFISLIIKSKHLSAQWLESGPEIGCFDEEHVMILRAVRHASNKGTILTKKYFKNFLQEFCQNKTEMASYEHIYDVIDSKYIDENDFVTLKQSINDLYMTQSVYDAITEWHKNFKEGKNGTISARKLQDKLNNLVSDISEERPTFFDDISTIAGSAFEEIVTKKESEEDDDVAGEIPTGIDEIDEQIGGLGPGTMTLFCADVGNYKTTMMLNVGLNAWERGKNVLFVPIEMARKFLFYKILSRQARVAFDIIRNPREKMTQDMLDKIKATVDKIENKESGGNFYIMEKPDTTSVSSIKREIEKHIEIFKPDLIIVDYIGILGPDPDTKNEAKHIRIGESLKRLRLMGKPESLTDKGFAIVSGAQIGRDALKRVRRMGSDKMSFHSEDLKDSHDYSADSDFIYAQMKDPAQEESRLWLFNIKNRYGKQTFSNGENKIALAVFPEISLISNIDNSWMAQSNGDIFSKVDSDIGDIDDIDFDDDDTDDSNVNVNEPTISVNNLAESMPNNYNDINELDDMRDYDII